MTDERLSKKWIKPTILLCSYGFFTYIKPSEPYITPFLMGPHKNLTEVEVMNQILPVWSYSYTAFLIPIFLLTDFLRYKPIIILQGFGYIGCYVLLVFAKGVPLMQLMQVFFGLATACEIGYYAYIYSVIDEDHYQEATSYVRTATQLGLFLGSALSQILVSAANLDYHYLNVITLVNLCIGFVLSLFLPFPRRTMYFYRQNTTGIAAKEEIYEEGGERNSFQELENLPGESSQDIDTGIVDQNFSILQRWKFVIIHLWQDMKHSYSKPQLLRWSIWWALSTCGWILVVNYIQNLWEIIKPSQGQESQTYNGAVESLAQILGAIAAFSVGYMKINWERWGEMFLGFGSVIKAGLLLVMSITTNIWICYAAYVVFIAIYNFVITVSQFRIAVGLSTERFALVFGINTFLAVVLNSILTVIIVDDAVLGLDVITQFQIYSGYFGVIATAYLTQGIYRLCEDRNEPQCHLREDVQVAEDGQEMDTL